MPGKTLTAQDLAPLTRSAWRQTAYQLGYSIFAREDARIVAAERDRVELLVTDRRRRQRLVTITLTAAGVKTECPCDDGAPCEHAIAACLAAERHLRRNPPLVWQTALAEVVSASRQRPRGGAQGGVIAFSLAQEYGIRVKAFLLPHAALPEELPDDGPALAQAIAEHQCGRQARPIYARGDYSNVRNNSPEVIAAATLIIGNYNYTQENLLGTLFPLLERCPLFRPLDENPLGTPVTIEPAPRELVVHSEHAGEDLRLSLATRRADSSEPDPLGTAEVASVKPVWILDGSRLFRLTESADLIGIFARQKSLVIPAAEVDDFLSTYLLPLAERLPLTGVFQPSAEVREEALRRVYLEDADGDLRVRLRFGYGDCELPYVAGRPETGMTTTPAGAIVRVYRQPEVEEAAWKSLSGYGLKRGEEADVFVLRKSVSVVDFLIHQVPRLVEAGYQVFGEEALTAARVNRNRPTLSLNVSSGIDWFDLEAAVHFGELDASWGEVLKALRKRERYVKLADGSIGALPEDWMERYRRLLGLLEEGEAGVRLSSHQITLLDELVGGADDVQVDPEFARRRDRLRSLEGIAERPVPAGFRGELRPYQKAGFDWLHFLHEYGFGGCLADDMGTGKTIQVLAFLQSLKERGEAGQPSLIVMPRSLLFNWQREAERFTPELRVAVHADAQRDQTMESFGEHDLILTTYGVMLREADQLREFPFHYVVLDESQAIKNPLSLTARAARRLRADHRLVLTGTPVENTTLELWSQFAFLNPGLLGRLEYFRKEFALPIERQGDEGAAGLLRRMIFPFILRRTKDQVAPELPPRTERIVYCEMEPAQGKAYAKSRDYYRALLLGMIEEGGMDKARMRVLEGLLRLRQISNHPRLVDPGFKGASAKFDELLEMLDTLRAEGHRALIFSQFTQMLALVRETLDERQIPYVYLDGDTRDRAARVDLFQGSDDIPFFLISLRAGGFGLNLTAADYVIHIDPWWNPAVEMQAADRVHRIGQEKPVFIYRMIMRDSVEEKILRLQESKRELVNQLVQTDSGVLKSLTRDDVEVLFS